MAGYPAKSALKIKFLPEFRAFNYQIQYKVVSAGISTFYSILTVVNLIWKKYICPHPLKFSNFFHDNRPDIRYPACRISGTCNRISGRIPDSKKGRISGATLVPRRGISEPRHVWRNPSTQDIYGLVARRIFITVKTNFWAKVDIEV